VEEEMKMVEEGGVGIITIVQVSVSMRKESKQKVFD
jgi:hypothetical protein